jgi:hypothetical protein
MRNGLYFNSRLAIILRLGFVTNYPSAQDVVIQYPFFVTQNLPKMEQAKSLELEILLTVRNNKTVPTRKFHELFEQGWNLYRSKFNELIVKKFLKISTQVPGICVFELNSKGEYRIDELLSESAREIESNNSGILNFLKRFQLNEFRRDHLCQDTTVLEAN